MTKSFLAELKSGLADSTGPERQRWAHIISENRIDIQHILPLLEVGQKAGIRCLWLLSDIGAVDPDLLRSYLPALHTRSKSKGKIPLNHAMARYWLIAGVPDDQAGEAIDLCFDMLQQPALNVSLKYNALRVLAQLTDSYPELKDEFKQALEDQLGKHTRTFDRAIHKHIATLNQKTD